jgi:ATP/maltotriose-dependent transcriptional regulator MalT
VPLLIFWLFFRNSWNNSFECGRTPHREAIEAARAELICSLSAMQESKEEASMPEQSTGSTSEAVRLTKRELEILSLVIEGHSSKKVAELLFISKRTVDFHLDNIYNKLHVSNRMQALQRATKLGLLPYEA